MGQFEKIGGFSDTFDYQKIILTNQSIEDIHVTNTNMYG